MSDGGGFGFDGFIDLAEARRLLGLAPGADTRAIRRAYADTLRAFDVDADPQGFADLREARDVALADARERAADQATGGDPLAPTTSVTPDLIRAPSVHEPRTPEPPADTVAKSSTPDEEGEADDASPTTPVTPDLFRGPLVHDAPEPETATAAPADRWTPEQGTRQSDILAGAHVRGDEEGEATEPHPHLADHARAFAALLAGGEADHPLTPDEAAAAHAHLDALFADPQLDLIEYRAGAEHWYADVAADAGPRADPVVPRIVAFFGWARDRGRFDQPPAQAAVLERADLIAEWDAQDRRAAEFREELEQPHHYYHRAWRDLSEPRGLLGWVLPRSLPKTRADLLATLRVEQPGLYEAVAPRRARWFAAARERFGTVGWLVIAFVVAARLLVALDTAPPADRTRPAVVASGGVAPPPAGLTSPDADIDPVLVAIGGGALNLPAVQANNPGWHRVLVARWQEARRTGVDRTAFVTALIDHIDETYVAALRRAPRAQVERARQLALDRLVFTRDRLGTIACGDLVAGEPVPAMVDRRFGEQRRALAGEVLLTMEGVPAAADSGRFDIPGAVYTAAARRADLAPAAFGRALDREGTSAAGCAAWIALYREALATPGARGLRLLREM